MTSQPLFLSPEQTVVIDGKQFKVSEIKEHIIDSVLYRKHLQELMEASE